MWQEILDGRLKVLSHQRMKKFNEFTKDLASVVNLLESMANKDILGKLKENKQTIKLLMLKSIIALPFLIINTFFYGFWPSSIFCPILEDEFLNDVTIGKSV